MQTFVGLTQLFERRSQECLVFVSLARTQGGKSVQANIDAHGGRSRALLFIWHLNRQGNKPPVSRFRNPCACHAAVEAQVLRHVDPAQLGNPDAMIPQFELVIGEVETGLAPLLAFEPGTTFPFPAFQALKERGERFAQVQKGLIGSVFGDLPGPGRGSALV